VIRPLRFIGVLLLVAASAAAAWQISGTVARLTAQLLDAPATAYEPIDSSSYVRVVVRNGMAGDEIAQLVKDAGVVGDAARFRALLASTGASSELQAGCYELPRRTPSVEVIRRMRQGVTTGRALSVPEGLRPEEVAERAIEEGIGTQAEWAAALEKVASEPGPLGRPASASLVGYLFPAAYSIECDTTPESLLRKMLETFEERVPDTAPTEAERVGLTFHEAVTLASIVEREAVKKEERPTIASVYLNRLDDDMGLAADPTVQFAVATPESVKEHGWWKQDLTVTDLADESPYNTYVHAGLPPGPIATPGLDAILATIRPQDTDFLYFVARGDGSHEFARTFAEHSRNVQRYLPDR
jgi:UPF0755 protein